MSTGRLTTLCAGLTLCLLLAAASTPAVEQQGLSDDSQTTFVAVQKKTKDKSESKKAKFRGRLPAYYGRVGISTTQRKKIYSIQKSYHERIEALERQLQDLKDKRDTEVEAVLTESQKKKVEELREAARKKRKGKSKSKKSKKAE